jgi:hypothetical protein
MGRISTISKVDTAIQKILNICNDRDLTNEFLNVMVNEHRTLQQRFTALCIAWLEHLATLNEGQYDLRNEAGVELAKKFVAATGDKYDRVLPVI